MQKKTQTSLTNAVCVCHAFPGHTVPPQALVHIIAGVTVLHPVVGCRGDNEEYVPNSSTEQPTSHEAVHPDKKKSTDTKRETTFQVRAMAYVAPSEPLTAETSCYRVQLWILIKQYLNTFIQEATNVMLEQDTSDNRNITH